MTAIAYPVLTGVVRGQRRPLTLWGLAVGAVTAVYVGFFPAIGGDEMASLVDGLPAGFVEALGYDQLGTAAGYIESTLFGLMAAILLTVFAIGLGARLIAGHEEDGTLELELTAPVRHRRQYIERLAALWLSTLMLTTAVSAIIGILAVAFSLDISPGNLIAATIGLLLLVLGFGTVAFAVGAATGRRAIALGTSAGMAVTAFMLNAIGPTVDVGWMTAISPWSWFIDSSPLIKGWDLQGLLLLAALPVVAAVAGLAGVRRRDLMV